MLPEQILSTRKMQTQVTEWAIGTINVVEVLG